MRKRRRSASALRRRLALAAILHLAGASGLQAATVITSDSGTALNFAAPDAPGTLGSNVSLAAPGDADFLTSPGIDGTVGTPDIGLVWSSRNASETQDWRQRVWNANNMSGGGALQIRGTSLGSAFTVTFTPAAHAAVVINGFHFIGDRDNPGQPYQYRVDVVEVASGAVVESITTPEWETDVTKTPEATGTWAGAPAVDVSFTGEYGKAYRLELVRIVGPAPDAPSTRSEVDMAIDNLSFDQLTGSLWTGADGDWDTGSNWNTGSVPASDAPVWITSGNALATGTDSQFRRGATTLIDNGALTLENMRFVLVGDLEVRSGSFVQNNATYFIVRGADLDTGAARDTRFLQTGGEVSLSLSRGFFLSDSTVSSASGNLELRGGTFEATLNGADATLHQVHIGRRGENDTLLVDGGTLRVTHNGPTDDRFLSIGRSGSLRVVSGTAEFLRFQQAVLGEDFGATNGTASMVVDGGSLDVQVGDALLVGDRYPGRLEVNGGRTAVRKLDGAGGHVVAGGAAGSAIVHNGGEFVVEGDIVLTGSDPGEEAAFAMSGGVLRATALRKEGSGNASFAHTGGELFLEGNQVAYLQEADWFVTPPGAVITFDATTNTTRVIPDYRSEIPAAGIPYQAYLTGPDGSPVGADPLGASAPVNIDFVFRVFDAPAAGHLLHSESQTLAVDRGAFGAILGSGSPLQGEPFAGSLSSVFPAVGGEERYLETSWRTSPESAWATVQPRVRMLGAPYAHHAVSALKLLNPDGDELFQSSNGSLTFAGSVISTGTVTLSGFTGEAGSIGNIDAGSIATGTFPASRLSLTAGHFSTGLVPVGSLPDLSDRITAVDGSKFTSGQLDPARLPANLSTALPDEENTFTKEMSFQTNATLLRGGGALVLNDHALQLWSNLPGHVGKGWLQYRNTIGDIKDLDGPVLGADRLGALGSRPGGKHRIAMEWDNMGRVTIHGKLTVDGGLVDAIGNLSKGRKYSLNGAASYSSTPSNLKVEAKYRIQAFAFAASSDRRSKVVLGPRDVAKDAALLQRLRVVDYSPVEDPTVRRKGFIAQEVRKVLPDAVTLRSELLPGIAAHAFVEKVDGEALLRIGLPKVHNLRDGDMVGISMGDAVTEFPVVRVDSPLSFLIEDPGSMPDRVFVVGRRVDDFHILDYDRIFLSGLHATRHLLQETASQSERLGAIEDRLEALDKGPAPDVLSAAKAALQASRGGAPPPTDETTASTLQPVSTQPNR